MSERIIEIKLKALKITNRGTMSGKDDLNAIAFTLCYPSAGKPTVSTVKEMKVSQPIPDDFSPLGYEKEIVFKETVQGDTQLTVDLAAIHNPSAIEELFTKIFKNVFKVVFGSVTSGIGNVALGAVAQTVGGSVFDSIKTTKSVQKIGRVVIPITESDLKGQGEITKELRAPEKVIKIETDVLGEETESVVLEKDQVNGTITLSYR